MILNPKEVRLIALLLGAEQARPDLPDEYRERTRALIDKVEAYDPLTVAPGADDLTFGSLLDTMIGRSFTRFHRAEGLRPREYTSCNHCDGNDGQRPTGQRPSLALVEHKPDCLLAKHLPRLQAMANKGAT